MLSGKEKIRVLIVDDSAFMRVLISDMLKNDADIEVAGTARNGKEGLEKAILLKPDIITLDIEMPVMNGLEALVELMK
ncbi:MAG TPA: response regulator, partial [Bacillota bacterium]|nr:response regulator [Bacillota bacterium]